MWIEKAYEASEKGGVAASNGMLLIAVREQQKFLRTLTPRAESIVGPDPFRFMPKTADQTEPAGAVEVSDELPGVQRMYRRVSQRLGLVTPWEKIGTTQEWYQACYDVARDDGRASRDVEVAAKDARIGELSARVLRAEEARDEAIDQHDRLEAAKGKVIAELEAEAIGLNAEIRLDNAAIADRNRVLQALECPVHGNPHALEAIEKTLGRVAELEAKVAAWEPAIRGLPKDSLSWLAIPAEHRPGKP